MSDITKKYLRALSASVLAFAIVAAFLVTYVSGSAPTWLLAVAAVAALSNILFLRSFWTTFRRGLEAVTTSIGAHEDSGRATDGLDGLAARVTALRARVETATSSSARLASVLGELSEAVLVTTPEQVIEYANPAALRMLGYAEGELSGRSLAELVADADEAPKAVASGSRPRETLLLSRDQNTVCVSYTLSELRDSAGKVERVVVCAQNVDERKRAEQRIRYLARTDPLTKIPNRMHFQHLLQEALARAVQTQEYLGLLYLDVDRFKDINDTFGHAAGDTSLEKFARRIVETLPTGAVAGRLAGDEFAVLVTGIGQIGALIRELTTISNRLVEAVGRPLEIQDEEIFMTTSIGIAMFPRDGDNAVDLIRNADAALYQAKKAGGNDFEFYSTEMNTAAEQRLMLKGKLRRAFERDELRVHYQPKYGLKSGRVEGVEALVRWDLPERGLVFPSDFIPLAEETNLILPVGEWVLNRVCADYRKWQRIVPSPCRVSVNLSLRQLQQQRFLEGVRNTFRAHGVSPTCFELEITETTLMEDTSRTIRILDSLYSTGLHLAIDDFGTGYSSLSALQQFPIGTLKIDRSFIQDLTVAEDSAAIVTAIIRMAHSLRLDVVAEGVESQNQLDFLRELGCDFAQGHLFGDPVTGEEFAELLLADAEGSGHHRALFA